MHYKITIFGACAPYPRLIYWISSSVSQGKKDDMSSKSGAWLLQRVPNLLLLFVIGNFACFSQGLCISVHKIFRDMYWRTITFFAYKTLRMPKYSGPGSQASGKILPHPSLPFPWRVVRSSMLSDRRDTGVSGRWLETPVRSWWSRLIGIMAF